MANSPSKPKKPRRPKTAVVLLSGGLDSATALYWAKARGYALEAVSFHYGQRHDREIKSAIRLARRAGARHHESRLPLLGPAAASALTDSRQRLPNLPLKKIGQGGIPTTYVPARNTMFLAAALSLADAIGAEAIVIGANVLDYSGYPDCRPAFLKAFEKVARLGTKSGAEGRRIRILAPLLKLDKAGIVRLARRLGVPLELTWSCYNGTKTVCGRCDSCKLRAKGFSDVGVPDPAL